VTRFQRSRSSLHYAVAAAAGAVVFLADLRTPLGIAVWVLYLAPVAVLHFSWNPVAPLAASAACTVLIVVGYVLSPGAVLTREVVQLNRSIGAVTLWVVGALVAQGIRRKVEAAEGDWIRAGRARLAERLAGELGVTELASRTARFLAEALGAPAAAVYVAGEDRRLRRAAAFAGSSALHGPPAFAPGEGLVGQCGQDRALLHVADVPDRYLQVASGTGAATVRHLLLAPCLADDELLGVAEVGLFAEPGGAVRELLDAAARQLGVALRSSQYREKLQALLEQTRQQAEELGQQGEELRVTNEELQQQAASLEQSQAQIEQGQAELEATNHQLAVQAKELETQRDELAATSARLAEKAAEVERASRYKSEFLANVSHELRTPLNSILILSKLLSDGAGGPLDDEGRKFAGTISAAGSDLLALINDVLDLSKIEAGRLEVRGEELPVRRLVEALGAGFEATAAQRGLRFVREVLPGTPEALVSDGKRVQQVLSNLLGNAFKFTEQGEVALRARPAPQGGVAFQVTDTGIGIAPQQQDLVFEAFRQADAGISRKYGGTGLGLSISRELARLLGGELTLASAPGQGSTFTLTLPARLPAFRPAEPRGSDDDGRRNGEPHGQRDRDGDLDRDRDPDRDRDRDRDRGPATATAAPAPAPPAPVPRRHGSAAAPAAPVRTLLIVEDDRTFADLLCRIAQDHGYECTIAATAEEAYALAAARPPSAVLLDVGLPDHSGLSVLERLKRNPATRHVPVHVVSGRDDPQAAYELGAVGYALKPAGPDQLEGVFARLEAQLSRTLRRVLVVEDDAAQRDAIARLLGGRGVEIVATGTVSEALDRLARESFDCMVMDLALPDGSGYELLDRMAREDRFSFPAVIVYTGRELKADEEARLRRYSSSIILKGARSPERLLDEVTLFLHRVEAELPPERRRMLEQARARNGGLEGKRILVVEDDVRNVFALASVLEPRGATVEIARNGREALEALQGDLPNLVLMDVMMPEMDGYEAMRRIRAEPRLARLPIVALTARAMKDDREKCLAAGANDYLPKPIDVDQLVSLVRVWLSR
jgi:CheY-like chemotaxis protein